MSDVSVFMILRAFATRCPEYDVFASGAGKGGGSLWLMIPFVVLVIALATLAPFLFRWRKRKILERTDAPNLSLTHEASPDRDKPELCKVA
jgi:hypothetical protein